MSDGNVKTAGKCLCGAVRYEIHGSLRDYYEITDDLPKFAEGR